MQNFLSFWKYIKLNKEIKKYYYHSAIIVCKNCQRIIRGYFLKGVLITQVKCPRCDCETLINQKEIK